jgi:uncharacterized protein YmfQ (DUF2313 family)
MAVRAVVLGLVMATLSFTIPAAAQDRPAGDREGGDRKVERDSKDGRFSDRDRRADWQKGEQALEQALKLGQDKAFYRKELEKQGYKVTAVNYDKPEYVEYEVVKGNQSYEVQIDFDKSGKASKVDVATNMWKADSTKRAMQGKQTGKDAKGEPRFSDRDRRADWGKGKEALERSLKPGQDKAFYRKELEKQGYKVTATNYDKPDYLEYEVVKGDQSYEVQISFDKNNRKANKIDVTTNMWQAEATERALESAKGRAAETPKGRPS